MRDLPRNGSKRLQETSSSLVRWRLSGVYIRRQQHHHDRCVPLGCDAKRAHCLPCQPASSQGGPSSVVMLPAAETRRDVQLPHRWCFLRPWRWTEVLVQTCGLPVMRRAGSRWEGACRRRVWEDVNGVQRGFCCSHFLLRRAIEIAV
jgi:hypothetical protein